MCYNVGNLLKQIDCLNLNIKNVRNFIIIIKQTNDFMVICIIHYIQNDHLQNVIIVVKTLMKNRIR